MGLAQDDLLHMGRRGRFKGLGGGALGMKMVAMLCIAMAGSIEAEWRVFPDSTPGSLDLFAPLTGKCFHPQGFPLPSSFVPVPFLSSSPLYSSAISL